MQKIFNKSKKFFVLFLFYCFFCVNINFVLADGMMIEPVEGTVWDQWTGTEKQSKKLRIGKIVGENSQQAFISWDSEKNLEKMMIVVNRERVEQYRDYRINKKSEKPLYWIVPIKSSPEKVIPHHYDKFSQNINVISVSDKSKNRLQNLKEVVLGMQIWPLLGKLTQKEMRYQTSNYAFKGDSLESVSLSANSARYEPVKVYKRVESFGVETKILSADSAEHLRDYLAVDGIEMGTDILRVIDAYIDPEYCFAVSRVVDADEKGDLGLLVEFETEKPFYPMYITSVYGSRRIGVEVIADGVYEPKMGISTLDSEALYLEDDFVYGKDQDTFFEKGSILTQIQMNKQAFDFDADIYFEKSAFRELTTQLRLNFWLLMVLMIFILSFLIGSIIFHKKWLKVGILNGCFGILGMIIGLILYDLFRIKKLSFKGIFHHSRDSEVDIVKFLSRINKLILIVPLLVLIFIPIAIFGGYDIMEPIFDIVENIFREEEFVIMFFFFILPISFLISLAALLMKKIIASEKVSIHTRKLLGDLLMVLVNIFELILFCASIVLFVVMGMSGWVVGAISIMILLWLLAYNKKMPVMNRLILSRLVYVFFIIGVFNIFAAIISIMLIYPYMICYYYISNIDDVSEYFVKKHDELKRLGGYDDEQKKRFDHSELVATGIALYSIIFVIVYIILDKIVNNIL